MFQSTPARGGRRNPLWMPICQHLFQSTPARGGRHHSAFYRVVPSEVSIHARARRATSRGGEILRGLCVSIHARARRATRAGSRALQMNEFQSTPARGGRPRDHELASPSRSFNPRPRAAGDLYPLRQACNSAVSIHARARRATTPQTRRRAANRVSIHARARRATVQCAG